MAENPFADDIVKLPSEAIMYDRVNGEVTVWKRIWKTEFYWQPGQFWAGMWLSVEASLENRLQNHANIRKTLEYLGLIE